VWCETGLGNPLDMMFHIQPWMIVSLLPLSTAFEGDFIIPSIDVYMSDSIVYYKVTVSHCRHNSINLTEQSVTLSQICTFVTNFFLTRASLLRSRNSDGKSQDTIAIQLSLIHFSAQGSQRLQAYWKRRVFSPRRNCPLEMVYE